MSEEKVSTENQEESQNKGSETISLNPARYSLMGQVLDDRYVVIDAVGEGDLTMVYMGQAMESRETVVIKTLKYDNPELIEKFEKEIQTFKAIKHPNMVEIKDELKSASGLPVVVMEYVEGVTLKQLLESLGRIDDENTILSVVTGICEALEYVHSKGLFHGNIDPSQVLISENEVADDFSVKVTDWGTAGLGQPYKFPDGKSRSYDFMSPEKKKGEYTAVNTDIFSLGALTYLLVAGKNPLSSTKLSSLVAGKKANSEGPNFTPLTHLALDLPHLTELNKLLEQALEQDPDWRMPSISQFKKELADWHRIAISEEFDEYDDLDLELDFESESEPEPESEPDSDFDPLADLSAISATEVEPVKTEEKPVPEPEPKQEKKERPDIRDEVTATAQSQVVKFEAGPSFYTDLYKKAGEVAEKERQEKARAAEEKARAEAEAAAAAAAAAEPVKSVTEEEVLEAAKKEPRKRRRRRSRSTQQNVRTTIRNLVALRENQMNQEETMAMQFAGKFSAKGPRLSPGATAVRLGAACIITAILTGLALFNMDGLYSFYQHSSLFLSNITSGEEEEPQPEEDENLTEGKKGKDKTKAVLKTEKASVPKLSLNFKLTSSSHSRLKLNKLEKSTPLASEFYKNWRHSAYSKKTTNNSRVGNRRRIDYRKFDDNWLK
ncbi:MAG: serine/threonine-protein kinase [Cyanobacteriota/Melainabacteria group bacterium]